MKTREKKQRLCYYFSKGKNPMIQKLNDADTKKIFDYISPDPEMTLFIRGDIEQLGMKNPDVKMFASVLLDGTWDFVVLKYRNTMFQVYSNHGSYDVQEMVSFLKKQKITSIAGKKELVSPLIPFFSDLVLEDTFMARCAQPDDSFLTPLGQEAKIRRLEPEDLDDYLNIRASIEEFAAFASSDPAEMAREKKTTLEHLKVGDLIIGVFVLGKLVAMAGTTASNKESAMVVSVCTKVGFRNKGYASYAVTSLCRESFKTGKKFLCLFYDNPKAGSIYHKIGFKDVGVYSLLRKKQP
jgi:predicted GNAT family acetyltransferase